jgi:dsRNA-specific ribonuclease
MLKKKTMAASHLMQCLARSAPASSRPLSSLHNKPTPAPTDSNAANLNQDPAGTGKRHSISLKPIPLAALKAAPPALHTLHTRLRLADCGLPPATLARSLICASARSQYVDNSALARFGAGVLQFVAFDHFVTKYPRLSPDVAEAAAEVVLGERGLALLAEREWGVEEDSRSALARYLEEDEEGLLLGKLRYGVVRPSPLAGDAGTPSSQEIHDSRQAALATFVRALVAGIYAHGGLAAARDFAQTYIVLPRASHVDIAALVAAAAGPYPVRALANLCAREGWPNPVSRLLTEAPPSVSAAAADLPHDEAGWSETGDIYSASASFIVGVFSGKQQLGQGQAETVAGAKRLAVIDALTKWYLAPVDNNSSSSSTTRSSSHPNESEVISEQ